MDPWEVIEKAQARAMIPVAIAVGVLFIAMTIWLGLR